MPSPNPTRQRLIQAALELFAAQGVTATTTKQIAELSGVNEVTLFRHFGNKHGLLLSVIEESGIFTQLGQRLIQQANQASNIHQVLKDYATACLQALNRMPEVVRSVVGEAGQFPAENREALGRGFTQANHDVAEYFATVIDRGQLHSYLPAEKLASLLNGMLLGYAVIEFTSEFHNLWQDRDEFLENLVTLFLHGAVSSASDLRLQNALEQGALDPRNQAIYALNVLPEEQSPEQVADLSEDVVHAILKQAKKAGMQAYALGYVLFGAGLSPSEVVNLERSHHLSSPHQQVLQISQGAIRQVPVNQWIMGKRYGASYVRNPLTQWLKSRKDNHAALFLNQQGEPLSELELRQQWQNWTAELSLPEGHPPAIEQAQQTWCVEMLVKGISLENLGILTGRNPDQLQPYAKRAKEKAALEQAIQLDQKG